MDLDPETLQAVFWCCVIAWVVVFGCLGYWVADQCGRSPNEGLVLGVLFGAFGVLIEALLPKFPFQRRTQVDDD